MKQVLITSTNPVKIESTKIGFARMFPTEPFVFATITVPSGVSDQPMSDEETLEGAKNRIVNARREYPSVDYYVGIEGGIETRSEGLMVIDWVVIENKIGQIGQAKMNAFYLPPAIAKLVQGGMELGAATDQIFQTQNIKSQESGIGLLTGHNIPRTDYLVFAMTLALIPFKNPSLYPPKTQDETSLSH